ncbi:MAG: YhbY family RNA-binding protein [Betaproteobacteria bacterium]|nr:YhbY family RNA-binding protein [Betaproteobacteria bacterium]
MLKLTPSERGAHRAKAHHLEPVVIIGDAGLTPAVLREIDVHLKSRELIKIRVHGDDRAARAGIMQTVCQELNAAPVQEIGKILVVYRPKPVETSEPETRKSSPRKSVKARRRTKRSYQG